MLSFRREKGIGALKIQLISLSLFPMFVRDSPHDFRKMRLFGSLFDSERLMRELRRSKFLLHSHHALEHEIVVVGRHILRALELRVHLANEVFHIANRELFGEKARELARLAIVVRA